MFSDKHVCLGMSEHNYSALTHYGVVANSQSVTYGGTIKVIPDVQMSALEKCPHYVVSLNSNPPGSLGYCYHYLLICNS